MPRTEAAVEMSLDTWRASSRVGHITSAWGLPLVVSSSQPSSPGRVMRSKMVMPKASVLPVPVRACPMRSVPSTAIGIDMAWIGNGETIPTPSNAWQISSRTPRSAKEVGTETVVSVSVLASSCVGPSRPGVVLVTSFNATSGVDQRRYAFDTPSIILPLMPSTL